MKVDNSQYYDLVKVEVDYNHYGFVKVDYSHEEVNYSHDLVKVEVNDLSPWSLEAAPPTRCACICVKWAPLSC